MDALLEQLMANEEERPLLPSTPQEVELPNLPGKASVLIGMRRVGKTWLLRQLLRERVENGWPREAILYLNLEDERLGEMDRRHLDRIVQVLFRRNPELKKRRCAVLLDEIQVVPGWEGFVRRLLDNENLDIFLAGSSAKLLSREIGTSPRGRALTTEVFPFSLAEALQHQGIALPAERKRPGSALRAEIERTFRQYLERGGFPEIQGLDEALRVRILQDYLNAVILRDIIERHEVRNTVALRRAASRCVALRRAASRGSPHSQFARFPLQRQPPPPRSALPRGRGVQGHAARVLGPP